MKYSLKQAIEVLESGNWCSIEVFKANVAKKQAGELLVIPKCRIARQRKQSLHESHKGTGTERNVNHFFNMTRNIELHNKSIITIHPILINKINNKQLV